MSLQIRLAAVKNQFRGQLTAFLFCIKYKLAEVQINFLLAYVLICNCKRAKFDVQHNERAFSEQAGFVLNAQYNHGLKSCLDVSLLQSSGQNIELSAKNVLWINCQVFGDC